MWLLLFSFRVHCQTSKSWTVATKSKFNDEHWCNLLNVHCYILNIACILYFRLEAVAFDSCGPHIVYTRWNVEWMKGKDLRIVYHRLWGVNQSQRLDNTPLVLYGLAKVRGHTNIPMHLMDKRNIKKLGMCQPVWLLYGLRDKIFIITELRVEHILITTSFVVYNIDASLS